MAKYILALDQGTTSSRSILFNEKGEIKSIVQNEYPQIYPKPGWVEHNPMEIWSSQLASAIEACAKVGASYADIAAIGITNQRETTIVWDKETGVPVYNAIVWQCRRTAQMVDEIPQDMKDYIQEHTGLQPDAYFSATKIRWILDHIKGAQEKANAGQLLFGTVDTWLMWNLSGRRIHATDYTNASRTMLFDIRKLDWDQKILDYFGIPVSMMPEVHASGHVYGSSDASFFGNPIPIAGVAGDQQAALFGMCCFDAGDVKNTYGTGCFLLMNTGNEAIQSQNGLITTIAAELEGEVKYALEGSIFIGGAVIQWLRDELETIKSAPLSEKTAKGVNDTNGVYLVPAFTGLGAPYWKQDARGTIVGVTRGFNRKHLVRAALEAIAYQSHDVIRAMEADAGVSMRSLMVDGGASANNLLMQFQADIVNTRIDRPKMLQNTALGAAYLAGLTTGFWKSKDEVKKNFKISKSFGPQMPEDIRKEKLHGWVKAVKTAIFWAELKDE
ncbi:MAG: glycerol kinase GlpK [Lachnospiraceae bacterium]|nr:glycerol kinase GlpK [Lachnospiraceae bacterium]